MDTAEKIYCYMVNNDVVKKDYFSDNLDQDDEYKLEHYFHTFINETLLSDSAKLKILKNVRKNKKKTIYGYFNIVQSEFNVLFYDMKI